MRLGEGGKIKGRNIIEGCHVQSLVLGFGDIDDQNRISAIKELTVWGGNATLL